MKIEYKNFSSLDLLYIALNNIDIYSNRYLYDKFNLIHNVTMLNKNNHRQCLICPFIETLCANIVKVQCLFFTLFHVSNTLIIPAFFTFYI